MENLQRRDLNGVEPEVNTVYNDGELALIENIRDTQQLLPCQLDIFAIVLVREGKATVTINGLHYEARRDDLFICAPLDIVEGGMLSLDFRGLCICVSTAYMKRIYPLANNSWDIKLVIEKNTKCSLRPYEVAVFCQYFDLLHLKTQHPTPTQKKVVDTLVLAFIYDMQGLLSRLVELKTPRSFTSSEALFQQFVELISSTYPKPRSVAYYAQQLNISPKYLSAICKQVGGKRASDLINDYVIRDIDNLFKYSKKSIKEIAYELDFPNLSFFGKYVKKHFNLSPKLYREKIVKEPPAF